MRLDQTHMHHLHHPFSNRGLAGLTSPTDRLGRGRVRDQCCYVISNGSTLG